MAKAGVSFNMDEKNGALPDFNEMLSRSAKIRGFLNRVTYPRYKELQQTRWVSQGVSQTGAWDDLKEKYLTWRRRVFPSSGSKILVRTGDLARSMTGADNAYHFKLITDKRMEVGTVLDYGQYVDEDRDITGFNEQTIDGIVEELEDYLVNF